MVVDDGKGRLKMAPIEAAEKKVLGERLDKMEKRRQRMEEQEIKKVFMGEILAVAESARGMRLGTALTLQSMELAKEKECEGYFAGLTGIYSQKIYRELDFSFEKELIYAEFKDKDGNIPFHDTLEHTTMKTAFKKL